MLFFTCIKPVARVLACARAIARNKQKIWIEYLLPFTGPKIVLRIIPAFIFSKFVKPKFILVSIETLGIAAMMIKTTENFLV